LKNTRTIEAYSSALEVSWNSFVERSTNGTFLFNRKFMEYHSDRFTDASLVIYDEGEVVGLIPATVSGQTVISHAGLTYGGLVFGQKRCSSESVLTTLSEICTHLTAKGIKTFIYKPVPQMYHRATNEADLYALYRLGAQITRRDLSSAISPTVRIEMRKGRKSMVQRAKKVEGLEISKSTDWVAFFELLQNRLQEKYSVSPVHTHAELSMLQARFPENIELVVAKIDQKLIAGCVIFETDTVVHAQYLATNELARENGAMDLLLSQVIERTQNKNKWFDFGISTTNNGRELNIALAQYKESFSAKSVIYDWYKIEL
jgi:hypothetical protein